MVATLTVDGLEELTRRLRALPPELGSKGGGPLRFAAMRASKVIKEQAERNLISVGAVDTQRLLGNLVTVRMRKVPQGTEGYMVTWRRPTYTKKRSVTSQQRAKEDPKNAFYGQFVELGTSKMAARPFLRPALESKRQEAINEFRTHFRKAIERAERKLARGR